MVSLELDVLVCASNSMVCEGTQVHMQKLYQVDEVATFLVIKFIGSQFSANSNQKRLFELQFYLLHHQWVSNQFASLNSIQLKLRSYLLSLNICHQEVKRCLAGSLFAQCYSELKISKRCDQRWGFVKQYLSQNS